LDESPGPLVMGFHSFNLPGEEAPVLGQLTGLGLAPPTDVLSKAFPPAPETSRPQ